MLRRNRRLTVDPSSLIWMLVALAVGFGSASPTPGDDPAGREPDATVVVTATRLLDAEIPPGDVPAHVTVITREQIAASGARTLQDVLTLAAGVVVYDQTGNGIQQTVDLRGFSGGRSCAVFLDGARINDPRNNTVALESIPLDAVERIEITRGSAAALAGGGSEAGILRIETRGGGDRSVSLTAGGGTHGAAQLTAATEGRAGRYDWAVSGSVDRSDGFRANAGGDLARFSGTAGADLPGGRRLWLSVAASDLEYGAPGALTEEEFQTDPFQNVYNVLDGTDASTRQATLNYRGRITSSLSVAANLAWRGIADQSLTTGRAAALYGGFALGTDGSSLGVTAQVTHAARIGRGDSVLVAGVEGLDGDTDASGWFTSPESSADFDPAAPDSRNTTARRDLAVFAQDTWSPSSRVSLTAGARWDRYRVSYLETIPDPASRGGTEFSEMSLRGGVVVRPASGYDLYASYGEAFLAPTAEQLFAFPLFGSNPDLRPQDSRSIETGLRHRRTTATVDVALFRIDTQDEIVFDPDSDRGPFGSNVNAGRTRRDGVECSARMAIGRGVDAFANYAWTDATFRSGADAGRVVPLVPRHRLAAGIDARLPAGFIVRAEALWVDDQVLDNDPANAHGRLDAYAVVNARAQWSSRRGLTLFVDARNLFDRTYATRGIWAWDFSAAQGAAFLTPAPGRRVLLGATWRS